MADDKSQDEIDRIIECIKSSRYAMRKLQSQKVHDNTLKKNKRFSILFGSKHV